MNPNEAENPLSFGSDYDVCLEIKVAQVESTTPAGLEMQAISEATESKMIGSTPGGFEVPAISKAAESNIIGTTPAGLVAISEEAAESIIIGETRVPDFDDLNSLPATCIPVEDDLGPPPPPLPLVKSSSTSGSGSISRLPMLLRHASKGHLLEQFYCQICLCNEPRDAGYALTPCGHVFCRECLSTYLTIKVTDAQVAGFLCPFVDDAAPHAHAPEEEAGCRSTVKADDLEALLDRATLDKLARFRDIVQNKNFRECPKCSFPNTSGPTLFSNRLRCGDAPKLNHATDGQGAVKAPQHLVSKMSMGCSGLLTPEHNAIRLWAHLLLCTR